MTRLLAAGILALAPGLAAADVNDSASGRRLSIPSSPVGVTLPREDWALEREQRRQGDTAVYYMLASPSKQLVFSVYIDKTEACKSAEACLEAALKNASYKEAQNLERDAREPMKFAKFYLDNPRGAPVKQAHILASAYVDGVWIDIHISKTGRERPDLAPLLELLNAITVK